MKNYGFSDIVFVAMMSICGRAVSQTNTAPFPTIPPVGIGTQLDGGTISALQIHFDPGLLTMTWPAILRLSNGDSTNSAVFGILGLMPPPMTTAYSSLSTGQDLILHENKSGDLILTNFWPADLARAQSGGFIRFATAGDATHLPNDSSLWRTDYERMTIAPNGNVGIDLPPDSASGLGIPMEQLQIGGGSKLPPFIDDPLPGLTFYGGNRFEGMLKRGGGTVPVDYRAISFNLYHDQWAATGGSASRFAHMSSSGIRFAEGSGGMVQLVAEPYDRSPSLDSETRGMTLEANGRGLFYWSDESYSDQYHHLFDVFRPGFVTWPVTRNTNGLFFHHTPVYIGSDTASYPGCDFTNLTGVNPTLGDGQTWLLAVNGPALFKEAWVNADWADFVFDSSYNLMPLPKVEQFIKANSHLPGVPSAKEIATTGVALGKTDATLLQKTEELTLYIIELNKKIERLDAKVQELEQKGGK